MSEAGVGPHEARLFVNNISWSPSTVKLSPRGVACRRRLSLQVGACRAREVHSAAQPTSEAVASSQSQGSCPVHHGRAGRRHGAGLLLAA